VPIFEYACEECASTFETIVMRSRAHEPQKCPTCGAENAKKLMSSFSSKSSTSTSSSSGYSAPVSSGGGGGFS